MLGRDLPTTVSKSTNRKSANSWAHSAIANPQISQVCQSADSKSQIRKLLFLIGKSISTRYCTALYQNSPKSRLCT